jgi:hypothetical protein
MGLLFVFATQSNQQIPWFGKVTRRLKPSNSGRKWLKPAEKTFTWRQWFFFQAISVSGHLCMHFIWKFCQTVAGIRMIHQFHNFFSLIFWRVFTLWPNGEAGSLSVVVQTTVMYE